MCLVIKATFENGVFKPDEQPELPERTRVRLMVEPVTDSERSQQDQAWDALQQLWQTSAFNSQGDRLSRDQLHERR